MADDHETPPEGAGVSRRGLIRGLATAVTAVSAGTAGLLAGPEKAGPAPPGPAAPRPATVDVNGRKLTAMFEPRVTLAEALRETWGLTGTKIGCDRGACGACTVLLDGVAVNSCLTLVHDADGRSVTTIEGLGAPKALAPIQRAFLTADALQCGFCTPGMVMSCEALLRKSPHPSPEEVRAAVAGNLCRCGTYPGVFEACATAHAAGQGVSRG